MLPCQVSRRRRHWTATSAGAAEQQCGPQGFAHPQQGFCRRACPWTCARSIPRSWARRRAAGTTWGATGAALRDDAAGARARAAVPGRCARRPSHLLPGQQQWPAPCGWAPWPPQVRGCGPHPEAMDSSSVAILAVSSSTRLAFLYRVTLLFQPFDDGRVLHLHAPLRQDNLLGHTLLLSRPTPALLQRCPDRPGDGLRRGIHQRLQGGLKDMDIGRAETLNGGLQGPESLHGNQGGNLLAALQVLWAISTVTSRPVLATDARMVCLSNGTRVRGLLPRWRCLPRPVAPRPAGWGTIPPMATTVTSLPSRLMSATPRESILLFRHLKRGRPTPCGLHRR